MNWFDNLGENVRIVIIDSGINKNHPLLKTYEFKGISILKEYNKDVVLYDEYEDEIGHGTAVAYVCKSVVPQAEIFIIKIFQQDDYISEESLILALEYVSNNIDCDIINVSCGVCSCERLQELRSVCDKLFKKGVTIVAAFDNYGRISYPAALENVIGVDATMSCYKSTEYQYVEGDVVNVRGTLYPQRLPGLNKEFVFDSGASFVAPYITAIISKMMSSGIKNRDEILKELKKNSKYTYNSHTYEECKKRPYINRAVLFPFNKEMHSLIGQKDLLPFSIYSICDIKYSKNVGKRVKELLKHKDTEIDLIIQNIEKLKWDADFDTVILGCTQKTSEALGQDVREFILGKCLQYKKNVYCFEEGDQQEWWMERFDEQGLNFYCPTVNENNVKKNTFGKLYECAKPVLLIAGTSPKQGKFNLQLELRKKFINNGYNIGQLGTEPTSLLFGMDEVYNMGFNSTVHLSGRHAISYINELVNRIELKNPDLIIVGSQSQTVQRSSGNTGFYPIEQYEFILGTQPDACILCVTVFDEIEYVQRTINFINSINGCEVLALMVFPYKYINSYGYLIGEHKKVEQRYIDEYIKKLSENINLKIFNASVRDDYNKVYLKCISFFKETN